MSFSGFMRFFCVKRRISFFADANWWVAMSHRRDSGKILQRDRERVRLFPPGEASRHSCRGLGASSRVGLGTRLRAAEAGGCSGLSLGPSGREKTVALGVSGFLLESAEVAVFKMRQKGAVSSQLCQEICVYFSPDAGLLKHVPATHGRAASVIFCLKKQMFIE